MSPLTAAVFKRFVIAVVAGLLLGTAGCSADAYRRSADAQVYAILRDRKYDTVGYNPQTSVGTSAVRKDGAGASSVAEAREQAADANAPTVKPGPGASLVVARAYEAIPATPLPPLEVPPLEPQSRAEPYGLLGPFPDQLQTTPAGPAAPTGNAAPPVGGEARDQIVLGPPLPKPPITLDLFSSVAYGVQHSRAYRDQMDAVYLAALNVTLERHLFEPRPFATLSANYAGAQKDAGYKSALTATANAGVRQKLPYGGEIVAEGLVSIVNAIGGNAENGESARAAISGSIPLLRGAGLVNLENLISSERELVYRIRDFEDFRRSYAVQVATQYFRVLTTLQSVNNRRQNVQNSVDLLERARVLFQAPPGMKARQSFLEVQRAEQSLLSGQDDLLRAQVTYLNALDDLKILLGMDVLEDLRIVPVALDLTIPTFGDVSSVAMADRYRLDLRTARDRVDDARRQVAVAQNGLMPDLSLTGRGQVGDRLDPNDAFSRQFNSRSLSYSAGIELDLPLDRVAERNVYRRSLINFYGQRRSLEDLRDQVAGDVRSAERAIQQAQNTVNIQQRSIELAQRRLENASLLLRLGASSSTRDFVEAQNSLLQAQDLYEQAKASLQVQVLQFMRTTGTLRVDPAAGALGRAMERTLPSPTDDDGQREYLEGLTPAGRRGILPVSDGFPAPVSTEPEPQ